MENVTPNTFPRAQAGQRLSIPADAWNALLDGVEHRAFGVAEPSAPGLASRSMALPLGQVWVKNATSNGTSLAVGDVVAIGDPPYTLSGAQLDAWKLVPIFTAVEPEAAHVTANAFGVLLDPLGYPLNATLARCLVNAVIARVSVTDTAHHAANIAAVTGQRYFVSAASGPVRILWRESGTGIKWALVRFGGGGDLPTPTQDGHVLQLDVNEQPYWGPTRVLAS